MLNLFAAALISTASPHWEFADGQVSGQFGCGLSQLYADGTRLTFVANEATMRKDLYLIDFENANWSIEEGQELGQAFLNSHSYHVGSRAIATNGGFMLAVGAVTIHLLLGSVDASGFTIAGPSNFQEIGPYAAGDIAYALPKFEACVRNLRNRSKGSFKR